MVHLKMRLGCHTRGPATSFRLPRHSAAVTLEETTEMPFTGMAESLSAGCLRLSQVRGMIEKMEV